MRRFLLAFRNVSNFRLQKELAGRLVSLGHRVDFVYEGDEDETCTTSREEVRGLNANLLAFQAFVSPDRISPPLRGRSPRPLRSLAADFVTRCHRGTNAYRTIHGQALAAAGEVLDRTAPDALIVNEDGVSGHLALITVARHHNIKILDVPFGYFKNDEFDAELTRRESLNELLRPIGLRKCLLRFLAPQWKKNGKFAGAVLLPDLYILAAEAMGITLENAWTVHGGVADVLCAESEETAERYASEGVRRGKIRVTGSPYCDVMFDVLAADAEAKRAFLRGRTIEPELVRILVSWPPSYHDTRPGRSEFPSYGEMTRIVLGALKNIEGARITVSLHPAAGEAARKALLDADIGISNDYVIELIPKHDIFVTSFSSTIRWATAAGKPVVNYDAYDWNFDQFNSGGFYNEPRWAELISRVSDLVRSPTAYRAAAEAQAKDARRWGAVDGRATANIVETLEELLREDKRQSEASD